MILYHGSDGIIENPDTIHSGKQHDFGAGFYVTSVKLQAERWAKRKALLKGSSKGIVNLYEYNIAEGFRILEFGEDLEKWIDFVCQCRNGSDCYKQYDVIKGKVADDKVFRVVDLYMRGIWDKERAIKEMHIYETYDQITFISDSAVHAMLKYAGNYEVQL